MGKTASGRESKKVKVSKLTKYRKLWKAIIADGLNGIRCIEEEH